MRIGGDALIREAITCDLCGTERKQTNHWFVAYDQEGEVRVSGLNSLNRQRPGVMHLCGQACVHKLVDEFMARTLDERAIPAVANEAAGVEQAVGADAGLTMTAAFEEEGSSARLLPPLAPVMTEQTLPRPAIELNSMPEGIQAMEPALLPGIRPRITTRNRRAEAGSRKNSPHARERRPDIAVSHRPN
jgi:hypothetical protein